MSNAAVNTFPVERISICQKKSSFPLNSSRNLSEANVDQEYIIRDIVSDDKELKDFLFTLGCFKGETVTVLSVLAENYVIFVKDARYSIDDNLAKAVLI